MAPRLNFPSSRRSISACADVLEPASDKQIHGRANFMLGFVLTASTDSLFPTSNSHFRFATRSETGFAVTHSKQTTDAFPVRNRNGDLAFAIFSPITCLGRAAASTPSDGRQRIQISRERKPTT
jgi:hypothetical protein